MIIDDQYQILNMLGKGGFGEVNQCIDELTGEAVAVKYLSFS